MTFTQELYRNEHSVFPLFHRRKGLEDYPDSVCTSNVTRQHSPALLFDLLTDPQELYPLNTRFYGEVLMAIAKVGRTL